MKKNIFLLLIFLQTIVYAQIVSETFNSTRIINGHSNETLKKRNFEYRIEHRFGDIAGTNGGAQSGFGFDNASDIRFAAEYGINDKLMMGIGRSKGNSIAYKSVIDGFMKHKILEQKEKGMPISMTFLSMMTYSYAKKSSDVLSISYFPKDIHRLAYSSQLIITRKFGSRLSLALNPTYVHRNYVNSFDQNDLFALGGAINLKMTKTLGLLFEYYHAFRNSNPNSYYQDALSVGFEWATNGHSFHFNFTNASLFNETQFIPATIERWDLGQFRLGFSIARTFKF
jgi:hypothetical protein